MAGVTKAAKKRVRKPASLYTIGPVIYRLIAMVGAVDEGVILPDQNIGLGDAKRLHRWLSKYIAWASQAEGR